MRSGWGRAWATRAAQARPGRAHVMPSTSLALKKAVMAQPRSQRRPCVSSGEKRSTQPTAGRAVGGRGEASGRSRPGTAPAGPTARGRSARPAGPTCPVERGLDNVGAHNDKHLLDNVCMRGWQGAGNGGRVAWAASGGAGSGGSPAAHTPISLTGDEHVGLAALQDGVHHGCGRRRASEEGVAVGARGVRAARAV